MPGLGDECPMTRINMGIAMDELCDQHLVAEYRELPRMLKFTWRQLQLYDMPFCLGSGHMLSCARYGAYLADRHERLIQEMQYRGFNPTLPALVASQFPQQAQNWPTDHWLAEAAQVLFPRIIERARLAKKPPTWSRRSRPGWAFCLPRRSDAT